MNLEIPPGQEGTDFHIDSGKQSVDKERNIRPPNVFPFPSERSARRVRRVEEVTSPDFPADNKIGSSLRGEDKLSLSKPLLFNDASRPDYKDFLDKAEEVISKLSVDEVMAKVGNEEIHLTTLLRIFEAISAKPNFKENPNFMKIADALDSLGYLTSYQLDADLNDADSPKEFYIQTALDKIEKRLNGKTKGEIVDLVTNKEVPEAAIRGLYNRYSQDKGASLKAEKMRYVLQRLSAAPLTNK